MNEGFKFQPHVCNCHDILCHDTLMISMKLSDIAIRNIHSVDYFCITNGISKSEDIDLM